MIKNNAKKPSLKSEGFSQQGGKNELPFAQSQTFILLRFKNGLI